MKIEDLETAKMEDMVDYWNANSKRKITHFADQPTAIKRMTALIEKQNAKIEQAEAAAVELTPELLEQKAAEIRAKRQAGTSKSWSDPEVRAKRIQRHGVEVDGVYYSSVADAFRTLGLPMNKCIEFRGELKIKGEDTEYFRNGVDDTDGQYEWKIVEFRKTPPKKKVKPEPDASAPTVDEGEEAPESPEAVEVDGEVEAEEVPVS